MEATRPLACNQSAMDRGIAARSPLRTHDPRPVCVNLPKQAFTTERRGRRDLAAPPGRSPDPACAGPPRARPLRAGGTPRASSGGARAGRRSPSVLPGRQPARRGLSPCTLRATASSRPADPSTPSRSSSARAPGPAPPLRPAPLCRALPPPTPAPPRPSAGSGDAFECAVANPPPSAGPADLSAGVAVKVLSLRGMGSWKALDLFENEARRAGSTHVCAPLWFP